MNGGKRAVHFVIKKENSLLVEDLINCYPVLEKCRDAIITTFHIIKETYLKNGKLLICGNGGSAADAEHISGELMKGFIKKRPLPESLFQKLMNQSAAENQWVNRLQSALPAIPLTVNHVLGTAIANDQGADLVFAQQVLGIGTENDTLLTISTSGNSTNIIQAARVAKVKGMEIAGLTGADGGILRGFCDVVIQVPARETYKIQELHLPVYHCLCAMLEEEFFS